MFGFNLSGMFKNKMPRLIQYLAVFTSTIGMLSYGMTFGWPSPSLPRLLDSGAVSGGQGGWLSVAPFVGALAGAPAAALLSARLGRKLLILLTAAPLMVSWLTIALCPANLPALMVARALSGVAGNALFTVTPTYIAEVTDANVRGRLAALLTCMWNLGVLTIYCVGPYLSISHMAWGATIVPVLFVASFSFMPESPYHLVMRGDMEQAKKSLHILRGNQTPEVIDKQLQDISEAVELQAKGSLWYHLKELMGVPLHRRTLGLVIALITFQELSGRSPFLFYSQLIFKRAGGEIQPHLIAILYGTVQLVSSLVGAALVDRYGRRLLLLVSSAGAALCLLIEGTLFFSPLLPEGLRWLPAVTLLLFVLVFGAGLGAVPMVYAGEVFARPLAPAALCLLDLYAATISIVIAKFFQMATDHVGVYVPFWTFAVFSVLGVVFIYRCLPETKGLTLEQIQSKLKS